MTRSWVFGYGSLIWRPAMPYAARRAARIHGWARRFWQASTDHRGTPAAPGRVVTLVPAPGAALWGVAYALDAAGEADVLRGLDVREQQGYDRLELDVELAAGEVAGAIATTARARTYVATAANPPTAWVSALSQYAFNLGIAFQLIDDVLDLASDSAHLGKNAGIDIAQGRGIAVALQSAGASDGKSSAAVEVKNNLSHDALQEAILGGYTVEDAIAKGRAKAQDFADQALAQLDHLPLSAASAALRDLAHQVIERDH